MVVAAHCGCLHPYTGFLHVLRTCGNCGALVRRVPPMYTSLSKMPRTTCSQDSSGPSSGDTPAVKAPSNTAHMSFSSSVRSPKTMRDMALPHVISWGLADLLQRQYHISAMASTSYAITCNPSMSSASTWAYAYAISSNRKRNIFWQWLKWRRFTLSRFTTFMLGAWKLGQSHTASLQWSVRCTFPGVPSLRLRMVHMRKDISSWAA